MRQGCPRRLSPPVWGPAESESFCGRTARPRKATDTFFSASACSTDHGPSPPPPRARCHRHFKRHRRMIGKSLTIGIRQRSDGRCRRTSWTTEIYADLDDEQPPLRHPLQWSSARRVEAKAFRGKPGRTGVKPVAGVGFSPDLVIHFDDGHLVARPRPTRPSNSA